jgi:hypothetical protein
MKHDHLICQDRLGTNVSGTLRKEAFPQGESEQAIASGSLLYCHFEEEAWSEAMHHYMLEAGDNAAVDGWWTDFGGAPGGVPVPVRKPFSFFWGGSIPKHRIFATTGSGQTWEELKREDGSAGVQR